MLTRPTTRCALVLPVLIVCAATGCASASGEEASASKTFEVTSTPGATPSFSPTLTTSLPSGAEDVWEMGLTGDLYADLETHYDGLHVLTGDNGMISAADWVARSHEEICQSDTEPMGGLGSQLDNSVRLILSNPDGFDAKGAVRVIASYGCPERFEDVNRATLKVE